MPEVIRCEHQNFCQACQKLGNCVDIKYDESSSATDATDPPFVKTVRLCEACIQILATVIKEAPCPK